MTVNATVTIGTYIKRQPKDLQPLLQKIRTTIRTAAPKATETMKYGLATFVYNGNLLHFGAFKEHIGFYPTPSGIAAFAKELSVYKTSKGAVQFPLGKPIPYALIAQIVKYRVKENETRATFKKSPKK